MNSIIFFPSLIAILSAYTFFGNKYGTYHKNPLIWIVIIIYVFILSIRCNFGTDQITYLHMYYWQGADLQRTEPVFLFINQILRKYNTPWQVLFGIIAFFEVIFIVFAFEKEKVNIFFGFIFFLLLYIFTYLNLSRQAIAMSISLLSIVYFANKNYLKWFLLVLFAAGFHISAIIALFIVPLLKIFSNLHLPSIMYYLPLILALLFFNYLFDFILNVILFPLDLALGGDTLLKSFLKMKIPLGTGLGIRLRIFSYFLLLPKILEYKSISAKNNFLFTLFYFGILGEFVSSVNMNLQRIFFYYSIVQLLFLPTIIADTCKSLKNFIVLKNFLFNLGIIFIVFLCLINQIKGIDTTNWYAWSLNFDLFNNHSF